MTLSKLSLPSQTNALKQTKLKEICAIESDDLLEWWLRLGRPKIIKQYTVLIMIQTNRATCSEAAEDCVVRITTNSRLTNPEFDQKRGSIRANLSADSSRTAISKRLRSRTRLTMLRRDSCHRRFIHISCSQKRALSLTSPRRYLGAMSIYCCGEN